MPLILLYTREGAAISAAVHMSSSLSSPSALAAGAGLGRTDPALDRWPRISSAGCPVAAAALHMSSSLSSDSPPIAAGTGKAAGRTCAGRDRAAAAPLVMLRSLPPAPALGWGLGAPQVAARDHASASESLSETCVGPAGGARDDSALMDPAVPWWSLATLPTSVVLANCTESLAACIHHRQLVRPTATTDLQQAGSRTKRTRLLPAHSVNSR